MTEICTSQPFREDCYGQPQLGLLLSSGYVAKSRRSRPRNLSSDKSLQSMPRPLHFVNTDAGSIGSKNSQKRTRDVKSHLSGHYRRWKKQQALSAQAIESSQQQPSGASSLNEAAEIPNPPSSLTTLSDSESYSESTTSPNDLPPLRDDQFPLSSLWAAAESTTLQNALSHGNSDPFGTLPLPVDARTNLHIQIFHEGTTVMCWSDASSQQLRDLLHHEALMHGVLAVAKIITATYLPGQQRSVALMPQSRLHYGQLLRMMRMHLEDRSHFNATLAIEMMHAATMFSFLAREFVAFELHLTSMKSLIDDLGGIQAIEPFHSSRFLNAERLRALFLQKKPLIPVQEWAPGSWFQENRFRRYDDLYRKAKYMMTSTNRVHLPDGPFSQQVKSLILDQRDMLAAGGVGFMLYKSGHPGLPMITEYLGFRSHALTIKTADSIRQMANLKRQMPSIETSLLACACLASNYAGQLIHFAKNPTVGLSYVPFGALTDHLREVDDHIKQGAILEYPTLYLWALFIGACGELASRTWACDPSFRGSSWCSTNFAYMISSRGISTLDDLKVALREYLFPYMFESYLRVLFAKRHELVLMWMDRL